MRPVARIAQSVEQGIENPRVLGSIPSPGTTIQRTQPMAGFLLFCGRTLHRTAFAEVRPLTTLNSVRRVGPLRDVPDDVAKPEFRDYGK